jgi:protein TonB
MFVAPVAGAGGRQSYTVLLSVAAHAFAIVAVIMVPLLAVDPDLLPVRALVVTFSPPPPLPAAPPPPAPALLPRADIVLPPAAPVEAPDGITPEPPLPPREQLLGTDDVSSVVPGVDALAAFAPPPPDSPSATPQAPVRLSTGIAPPVKIADVLPAYPPLARSARVEGVVIIEAIIDPMGRVTDARVLRSIPLLDAAALDAVRQWRYSPTRLNGEAVSIVMTITVNFRLR